MPSEASPAPPHALIERLVGLVGPDAIELFDGGPGYRISPGTVDLLCETVRLAADARARVLPIGGLSRWWPGRATQPAGTTRAPDLWVDTTRLHRLLDHDPEDRIVRVQAGARWSAVQSTLAREQLYIPLDPADAPESTVGGLLASDACGSKRLRFGTVSDWVLEMEVVRADGTRLRSQSAGRDAGDFQRVFIGSWGSLGIIVEATLRVSLLPAASSLIVLPIADPERAAQATGRLLSRPLPLVSSTVTNARDWYAPRMTAETSSDYWLALRFEGSPPVLPRQLDAAQQWLESDGLTRGERVEGEPADRLQLGLSRMQSMPDCSHRVRLAYPADAYEALAARWNARLHNHPPRELTLVGSGVTWFGWTARHPAPSPEHLRSLIDADDIPLQIDFERWPDLCAVHLPAAARADRLAAKSAFDPHGVFCEGPFA